MPQPDLDETPAPLSGLTVAHLTALRGAARAQARSARRAVQHREYEVRSGRRQPLHGVDLDARRADLLDGAAAEIERTLRLLGKSC